MLERGARNFQHVSCLKPTSVGFPRWERERVYGHNIRSTGDGGGGGGGGDRVAAVGVGWEVASKGGEQRERSLKRGRLIRQR